MAFARGGHGNPENIDLFGLWGAVVEDDKDPDKRGRIRVRVFDYHDEDTPVDELPWATPCFPSAFCQHNNGRIDPNNRRNGGFFHIPPVDALVYVMFQQGNTEKPVWVGGWFPANESIHGRETYTGRTPRRALYNDDGIPSCPSWSSLRGFSVEFDDEAAEMRLTTPKGHKVTLSDNAANEAVFDGIRLEDHKGNYVHMDTGNDMLSIYWNGDVQEHYTGNVERTIDGNLNVKVAGNVIEHYLGDLHSKQEGDRNVDTGRGKIYHNSNKAVVEDPTRPEPGTPSSGDHIRRVLAALGNQIRKIVARG